MMSEDGPEYLRNQHEFYARLLSRIPKCFHLWLYGALIACPARVKVSAFLRLCTTEWTYFDAAARKEGSEIFIVVHTWAASRGRGNHVGVCGFFVAVLFISCSRSSVSLFVKR
ncbi:hypothetical protein BV22DRAFT_331248 [Leucogyrophana mollusca]|uniref:Uncharacterized protein n=1 Tax=Leucogyrophana mollusca TaxID=85980 RepID=A0ACB8BMG1_9AGAM|nr:hypothetical protein BV22DRAFT_331248 [Leucogyrophana mollusca]